MIAISPRVPGSITQTPYAIQTCLLHRITAYKYHLFTFPHYLSCGSSLQNWSPRSTQHPQAHIGDVLETDPGNWFGGGPTSFPPIFDNLQ